MSTKKTCPKCKRCNPSCGFYRNGYCKECGREYYKQLRHGPKSDKLLNYKRAYQKKHRAKINSQAREQRQKLKSRVIAHYGGQCVCCGEKRIEFLCLDHKNNDGSQHRKQWKWSAAPMYQWAKSNGFPEIFEVRCYNCNFAIGAYGFCPHNPDIRRQVKRPRRVAP